MLLEVKNINKIYKGDTDKALENVSFDLNEGEFLSILGPSGCGKTTLLRILIGLLEPTSGRILLNDKDITFVKPGKREMGIVFQNYALFENMTVLQNVEYALKLRKEFKKNSKNIAKEMLAKIGLSEFLNKYPGELSGGQQQRVAIARTLVLKPKIILFDEPMSALDVETRLVLREELKKIQKKFNIAMIYITHDQEEAFALSEKIIVMNKSKIEQIGTPLEIIKKPKNDYIKNFVIKNLKIKIQSLSKYANVC